MRRASKVSTSAVLRLAVRSQKDCRTRALKNRISWSVSFEGYGVIAAIECLYYLTPEEQEAFFAKVSREHRGKPLIISGPIIGSNEYRKYFTDVSLRETFARHGLSVLTSHNLNVYRRSMLANIVAVLVRLPFGSRLLDYVL